jgi:hypothetical protein
MAKKFTVVAHLPASIDLTKRTAKNGLSIDVKVRKSKKGTLIISRGGVEWWPDGNSVNARGANWDKVVKLLETHLPEKRSKRKTR